MAPLPRTRQFQTRLDQTVFKLNGIVILVHQLPNLKRILFKKRPIFHLRMPNVARWFEFSITVTAVENGLHTKNRPILQFFNWEGIVLILPKSPLV